MQDQYAYSICLDGQINLEELNVLSPQEMRLVRSEPRATTVSICADQSGLIGLLRHLHGLGFVILSLTRQG